MINRQTKLCWPRQPKRDLKITAGKPTILMNSCLPRSHCGATLSPSVAASYAVKGWRLGPNPRARNCQDSRNETDSLPRNSFRFENAVVRTELVPAVLTEHWPPKHVFGTIATAPKTQLPTMPNLQILSSFTTTNSFAFPQLHPPIPQHTPNRSSTYKQRK